MRELFSFVVSLLKITVKTFFKANFRRMFESSRMREFLKYQGLKNRFLTRNWVSSRMRELYSRQLYHHQCIHDSKIDGKIVLYVVVLGVSYL